MSECHCPTLLCTALGGLYIQPLLSSSILQIIIRKYLNCGESVAWTGRHELCTLIPDPGREADHHHGSDEDPVWSVWAYDALIVCVFYCTTHRSETMEPFDRTQLPGCRRGLHIFQRKYIFWCIHKEQISLPWLYCSSLVMEELIIWRTWLDFILLTT